MSVSQWHVIVPIKRVDVAKTRLGDVFGAHRPEVALAFARDTVAAALTCAAVCRVTVVTGDSAVASAFADTEAAVIDEGQARGINAAISVAIKELSLFHDSEPIAVLLGDLPALTPAALAAALELAERYPSAFVPDAAGSGTTLLCARRFAALRPHFGADSAVHHEGSGAVRLHGDVLATLQRDIDDVDDLVAAVRLGLGAHTLQLLDEIGWAPPAFEHEIEGRRACT